MEHTRWITRALDAEPAEPTQLHPIFAKILEPYQNETGQALRTPSPSSNVSQKSTTEHEDTVSCCAKCGSTDVDLVENFGAECSETGSTEADDYWKCYGCGARTEELDERPANKPPTVIVIPHGSIFQPETEDLLRWSYELAVRAKALRRAI